MLRLLEFSCVRNALSNIIIIYTTTTCTGFENSISLSMKSIVIIKIFNRVFV